MWLTAPAQGPEQEKIASMDVTESHRPVTVRWAAAAVALVALAVTALKIRFASTTWGTNDVGYWTDFAYGVGLWGPVDVYGHGFRQVYNHPPLATDMLVAINWIVERGGPPLSTLVKLPAIIGDLVTSLVVFDLIRRFRPLREATLAGLSVALSPVLFVISGFHGNTDPVFVTLALVATWLLATRTSATLAGLFIAAAVSVKLIPVVLVPILAYAAWRWGVRHLVAFLLSSGALMAVIWLPTVLGNWDGLRTGVLGYAGNKALDWGILRFLDWMHAPAGLIDLILGPGRWLVLLVCAVGPVLYLVRRPDRLAQAVGLSLVAFLLLSPAFAMQYLAWPLAAAYLVNVWAATVYNVVASVFIGVVYMRWNSGAWPWDWDKAVATPMNAQAAALSVIAWLGLAAITITGMVALGRARRRDPVPAKPLPPAAGREQTVRSYGA
jgi:hypothetical protein